MILFLEKRPNQSMKPTAPRGCNLSVFATAPLAYLFFVRLLAAE